MNDDAALKRLGNWLYLMAFGFYLGTIVELIAAKHYDSTLQLVPFALCGAGIVALILLALSPTRLVVWVIRALMLITFGGSLLGVYEHIQGNLDFVHEVRRHADRMTVIRQTFEGGNPVLAPVALAAAAGVTLAATYARTARLSAPVFPTWERPSTANRSATDSLATDH